VSGGAGVSVQYRITRAKGTPDLVEGPDDAELVVAVPLADALTDPNVAYMQGRLKPTGPTGPLFELLRSGELAAALRELAARA
jgi:hypothetical protein